MKNTIPESKIPSSKTTNLLIFLNGHFRCARTLAKTGIVYVKSSTPNNNRLIARWYERIAICCHKKCPLRRAILPRYMTPTFCPFSQRVTLPVPTKGLKTFKSLLNQGNFLVQILLCFEVVLPSNKRNILINDLYNNILNKVMKI